MRRVAKVRHVVRRAGLIEEKKVERNKPEKTLKERNVNLSTKELPAQALLAKIENEVSAWKKVGDKPIAFLELQE